MTNPVGISEAEVEKLIANELAEWGGASTAMETALRTLRTELTSVTAERDKARALLADLIEHDGGEGSKDYHACKYYDARQAALQHTEGQSE